MRFIVVVAAVLFSPSPGLAQFQVPVECTELAAREGFPTTTLTKFQVARARARMALLSDRDPLVKQCRGCNPTGHRHEEGDGEIVSTSWV